MKIIDGIWIVMLSGSPLLVQSEDSITVTMRVAGEFATSESDDDCEAIFAGSVEPIWTVVEGTCSANANEDATWYYGLGYDGCTGLDSNLKVYDSIIENSIIYEQTLPCEDFPLEIKVSVCAAEYDGCLSGCCDNINMVYSIENLATCRSAASTSIFLDCMENPGSCDVTIELNQTTGRSRTANVELEIFSLGSCSTTTPTSIPTDLSTERPSMNPTQEPSNYPSNSPTQSPTSYPTPFPSVNSDKSGPPIYGESWSPISERAMNLAKSAVVLAAVSMFLSGIFVVSVLRKKIHM